MTELRSMRYLQPVAATLLSLSAALAGSASSAQTTPAPARAASAPAPAAAASAPANRPVVEQRQLKPGDYIAAIVNTDIVAASEVIQRTERASSTGT